jgi:hypothetical protein
MPRTFLDAPAQSTSPGAITAVQTTLTLASTANFGAPTVALPTSVVILDSGNPAFSAATPFATPFEYQLITNNNQGTNVLTINNGVRGNYAGTTPKAFFAGATVAAVLLAEDMQGAAASLAAMTGTTGGSLLVFASDATSGNYTALDFGNTGQTPPVARIGMRYTASGSALHFGVSTTYASGVTADVLTLTPAGHLLSTGSTPTLGALQSGVSTQSVTGTDSWARVSITTAGASPPGVGTAIFILNFAAAWGATPFTTVTENGTGVVWAATASNSASSFTVFHGGTSGGVVALNASTTYNYACQTGGPL